MSAFRPDIQGLRGIAVLLVVAYHSKFAAVPAGYVGVDVFLVISGYIIASMLQQQPPVGWSGYLAFLHRRASRLLPAAIAVIALTLVAGFFIQGPHDLQVLAGSCLAALLMVSNFYFWGQQGYFADQHPEQPLLHTWSLGLEVQFYLICPLIVALIVQMAPRLRGITLVAATVLLLVFCVWLTGPHPGAAFYLLPARLWEFLAGISIALACAAGNGSSRRLRSTIGLAGIAMILLAATQLSPTTPYPGLAALLPVSGAAAVIASNGCQTIVGRWLSAQWLVAVGNLSYSIYLVHWPVLSFARYFLGRDLDLLESAGALLVTAGLSYASWKWIERLRPVVKKGAPWGPGRRWYAAVVLSTIAGSLGAEIAAGFPSRLTPLARALDDTGYPGNQNANACHRGPPESGVLCTLFDAGPGRPHLLLWGDSHANALSGPMVALGQAYGVSVTQATYSNCPPFPLIRVAHSRSSRCAAFNSEIYSQIQTRHVDRVLMVAYWSYYLPPHAESALARWMDVYSRSTDLDGGNQQENEASFAAAAERTVQRLHQMGVRIWVLRQVPTQREPVPHALSRAVLRGKDPAAIGVTATEYRASQSAIDAAFTSLGGRIQVIDPSSILCQQNLCSTFSSGRSLYIDSNHLSSYGALSIEPVLRVAFEVPTAAGAARGLQDLP